MEVELLLVTCQYCGRIHQKSFDCGKKPSHKKVTYIDRFRWSRTWKDKAKQIKERDKYLCQACIRMMKGTVDQYTHERLSVHHIVPISEDYDKRLDDNNLITLCAMHHELAEAGELPRQELLEAVEEQEGGQVSPAL